MDYNHTFMISLQDFHLASMKSRNNDGFFPTKRKMPLDLRSWLENESPLFYEAYGS